VCLCFSFLLVSSSDSARRCAPCLSRPPASLGPWHPPSLGPPPFREPSPFPFPFPCPPPKSALTPLPGQSRPPSASPTRPPPPSSFVWVMSLVAGGLIKLPTDPCQPKADRAAKSSFLYNALSLCERLSQSMQNHSLLACATRHLLSEKTHKVKCRMSRSSKHTPFPTSHHLSFTTDNHHPKAIPT